MSQYGVLKVLQKARKKLTSKEIAKKLKISHSTTIDNLRRLCKRKEVGYIEERGKYHNGNTRYYFIIKKIKW